MSRSEDCYLLGAGFSKAINSAMPVLAELKDQVLVDLELPASTLAPFGDNLEEWLSHLATNEPWLDDEANLRNSARFLEASKAVYNRITLAEEQVVAAPPPTWLIRLLYHWAQRSSVLTTFNYDLLVERMLTQLRIASSMSDIYGASLQRREPPSSGLTFGASEPRGTVPTMFKLHGSRNWYYGGSDAPATEPIVMSDRVGGWRPRPSLSVRSRDRYLLDGLAPMAIPPTVTKPTYYANTALRAQWKRAAESFASAKHIIIIGYSFPPSDLQVRNFLATNTRPEQSIVVVDLSENPAEIVRKLLPDNYVLSYTGIDAVETFTRAHAAELVSWRVLEAGDGTFRPQILVGDTDVTADGCDVPVASRYEIVEWLRHEVGLRWSGLYETASVDPRATEPERGDTPPMVAYMSH